MKSSSKQKGLIVLSFLSTLGISIGLFYYLNRSHLSKNKSSSLIIVEQGINEPIKDGLPFESVQFNAQEGLVFHRPNGTHVEIPANSIVDKNGDNIFGDVEFRFREMQNAKDIFLSGIPMQMQNDRSTHLQSMGMTELRVFKDNVELYLKEGASLKVDLATKENPDENYDLWVLTDNENWEQKGKFETVLNIRREEALKNLPVEPIKPIKPKQHVLFQLASDRRMPHLKVWNNIDWKLIDENKEKEIYHAMRINWDDIIIEPINEHKKTFKIKFISKKKDHEGNVFKDSISITASPDVKQKDMKKLLAQYDEALKDYAEVLKKRQMEEQRILKEAELLNTFTVNGFGIYNIDKMEQTNMLAKINATFDFQNKLDKDINQVKLIMICHNENTVLTFYPPEWSSLPIFTGDIELVAILPNGEFSYISSERFQKQLFEDEIDPSFENKRLFNSLILNQEELRNILS